MRRTSLAAIAIALCVAGGRAQSPSAEPYKVLRTAKVGGPGGFDYVYADVEIGAFTFREEVHRRRQPRQP
jgi:hypothetical protein